MLESVRLPENLAEKKDKLELGLPERLLPPAAKGSNASQAARAAAARAQRGGGGDAERRSPNPHASTMLKVGSTGEAVRYLQNELNAKGAALGMDGMFGGQTRAAVVSFQSSAGLVADGVVGPQTWGSLGGGSGKVETPESKSKGAEPVKDEPPKAKAPPAKQQEKSDDEVVEDEEKVDDGSKTDGEKFREAYVKELLYFEGAQEHGHNSDRFQEILPSSALAGARKNAADAGRTFTTCNTFSGILQSRVEQKTGVKLLQKINLHVMDPKWREQKLPPGAFVKCEPGTGKRPQAGDIVVLTKKDGFTFKHMANMAAAPIVNDDGTEQWDCIDGGQGQAHDSSGKNANEAIMRIGYQYNPTSSIVTKPPWDNRERLIYGWIDIAKLAGG